MTRRLVALAIALAAMAVAVGCRSDSAAEDDNPVSAEIELFTMDHYRGAEPRWTLNGERAEAYAETVFIDRPHVLLYENGQPMTTITGDRGQVNERTYNLTITGNVRAAAPDGELFSEKLLWDDEDGTLTSPGDVEIRRRDSTIWAKSMTGFPNLKNAQLFDVTFNLKQKDETIEPYPLQTPRR